MRLNNVIGTSDAAAMTGEAPASGRMADLYKAHAREALRLAYLLTGDRELAEDLTQDAFVGAVGRFHDLRNKDAFGAYLKTAVVNAARSHFRRLRLERTHLAAERARVRPETVDPPDMDGRDALRRALLELPIRQRAALVLRYFEDLSEQQAADALGCSPAAAKQLVVRAMEALRRQTGIGELRDRRSE